MNLQNDDINIFENKKNATEEKLSASDSLSDTETVAPAETTPVQSDTPRNEDFVLPPVKQKGKSESGTKILGTAQDEADDFIYTHYHGKLSRHYSSQGEEAVVRSASSEHHHSHHHKRHRHRSKSKWKNRPAWQKLLIILGSALGFLAVLLLIAVIILFLLKFIGLAHLTNYNNIDMTAPDMEGISVSVADKGRTVTYKGKQYSFNDDVTSILCMGVDKDELGLENNVIGTAGQADAIYLVALNTNSGETTVIGIPRDIVTDIGIYSEEGEYLRTEKMQLCLAYAYGDGRKTSCLNTTTAVSRLFYQLPINSYYAINLSAIAELNDAAGGVTVTMIDDSFYDTNYVHHYKGETLTLYGDNARKYLQQREVSQLESSLDRMDRQINYMKAFSKKTIEMTKSDLSTPVEMYDIISDNSATNLTASKITAFGSCIVTNGINELDFVQVPGHITSDGTYAEYVVDQEALYEMILDIFYTHVE